MISLSEEPMLSKAQQLSNLTSENEAYSCSHFPGMTPSKLRELHEMSCRYRVSVQSKEIILVDDHWYITHSGLLRIAARSKCVGIRTMAQENLCDPAVSSWVFKAV